MFSLELAVFTLLGMYVVGVVGWRGDVGQKRETVIPSETNIFFCVRSVETPTSCYKSISSLLLNYLASDCHAWGLTIRTTKGVLEVMATTYTQMTKKVNYMIENICNSLHTCEKIVNYVIVVIENNNYSDFCN